MHWKECQFPLIAALITRYVRLGFLDLDFDFKWEKNKHRGTFIGDETDTL